MSEVVPIRADVVAPDFITRVDISKMNDEQLETLIEMIKLRRMSSFVIYQQTVNDREQIAIEKAAIAVDKMCDQIIKQLNTVDKNMEKLETQINKLRGLRIQAGLNIV